MKYILASASPRRRELLSQAGFSFEVCPSDAEEKSGGSSPAEIVEDLAALKARDIFEKCQASQTEDFTVIGADTVVAYNGEILGKPADEDEALDMLSMLADRTHQVYTGVCLIAVKGKKKYAHLPRVHPCQLLNRDKRGASLLHTDRRSFGQGRSLRDSGALCRACKGNPGRLQQRGRTSHREAVPRAERAGSSVRKYRM